MLPRAVRHTRICGGRTPVPALCTVGLRLLCSNDCSNDCSKEYNFPTQKDVIALPRKYRECSSDVLFILANQGCLGARRERLRREIMRVDKCDWSTAHLKFQEINMANDKFAWLVRLPYQIGTVTGVTAAVTAVPLVFHRDTAAWFNDRFVHESLPDGGLEALDTIFKVGNWTWGWMEPYLGTASFVLLGMQFTRAHMQRLKWKPYTERVLAWRANRLARLYPQYEEGVVKQFAEADDWTN
eukprot:gnl/Spiro4/16185_TR8701_c0_g1_i1.p1 gnl/Spiro4/16185_TR8701_c0_g1~~gnl/Spiro4/16185_TR8701_c0_g1_i1.p1  ORF type:complete len:256 (-),score=65.79 gnl/Spiro4/16185_TR8701_c0_g1_i1:53-775(-)